MAGRSVGQAPGERGSPMREIVLPAAIDSIPKVTAWIDGELEQRGCAPAAQMQIDVAVDEIITNIASYAYPEGGGDFSVCFSCEDGMAEMTFADSGIPYNPLEKPDPDTTLPAEQRPIGGLGIFLVRKMSDEVLYRYEGGKNILTIRKKI